MGDAFFSCTLALLASSVVLTSGQVIQLPSSHFVELPQSGPNLRVTKSHRRINSTIWKPELSKFYVCSKTPESYEVLSKNATTATAEIVKNLRYDMKEVLQSTLFSNTSVPSRNGFVNAVMDAYAGHHNLIIRPDDVWAAIMTQFSFYINKHAEKFRGKFVNFEGKRKLEVFLPGTLRTAPYDMFVQKISDKIHENLVDPKVKNWILPSFSTTTENDVVSVGVIFMASMKKYFDYSASMLCGIPSITLDGTVKDWKKIYRKLKKLDEYELTEWHAMLKPILKQFVKAKLGNVDREFWEKICHVKYEISGCVQDKYLSGWITAFSVFDTDGTQRKSEGSQWLTLDVETIPSGVVEVDVKITEHGGKSHNAKMFAGHMAIEVKEEGYTLQPSLGWAMTL